MCRLGKCSFSSRSITIRRRVSSLFRSLNESAINPLAQSQIELKRSGSTQTRRGGGSKKLLLGPTANLSRVEFYCGFYEFFFWSRGSFPGVCRYVMQSFCCILLEDGFYFLGVLFLFLV
jgi:hypothetical protein